MSESDHVDAVYIVTGAASGLGLACVKSLVATSGNLVFALDKVESSEFEQALRDLDVDDFDRIRVREPGDEKVAHAPAPTPQKNEAILTRTGCAEYLKVNVSHDSAVVACGETLAQSIRRRVDVAKLNKLVLIANAGVGFDMPMLFNPKAVVYPHTLEKHIEPWMARYTMEVNFLGVARCVDYILVPLLEEYTKSCVCSLDVRLVVTCSGAGRLNLGRMLCREDDDCVSSELNIIADAKDIARRLMDSFDGIPQLQVTFMEHFCEEFEATVSRMKSGASGGAGLSFPTYGDKRGYYLSAYGFSKALLHQAMRIWALKHQGKLGVYGCFPGVVLTSMNKNVRRENFEKRVRDEATGNELVTTSLKTPSQGASTLLWLAAGAEQRELVSGRIYNPARQLVDDVWWEKP